MKNWNFLNYKLIFNIGPKSYLLKTRESLENVRPFNNTIALGNNKKIEVTNFGEIKKRLNHLEKLKLSLDLKSSPISWEKGI